MPNAIRLHRVLTAKPEKIYRAFLEPEALARWLPPNGFTGTVHQLEPKIGGTHRMSFTNFTTGARHSFGGEYRELVPYERLRYTDRFDDPNLPGEIQVTVTLKKVSVGTELTILQEGIPDAIPLEACYLGWQESLQNLARLVEPEIPNERRRKRAVIMKCMVIVKASKDSEKGVMPGPELLAAMGKYNEELIKAGIMQGGGGLKPTSEGKRVRFSGAQRTVVSGPFTPTEEQISGYWLWHVKSLDEAVEWLKRCPNPMLVDSDIEIRPEFEAADFAR